MLTDISLFVLIMWNMPTGEPPQKIKGSAPLYLPQLRWCGKSTITKLCKACILNEYKFIYWHVALCIVVDRDTLLNESKKTIKILNCE